MTPGNEIWDKIGYNSAYIRDIPEIFVRNRGFGVALLNDGRQILPRPAPVAMATKFGTKEAITRLVYEISRRSLCICAAQTKTQKIAVLPQKSRTQLHIATY